MTREKNLEILREIYTEINESENAVCYLTSEDNEVIQAAIKALEQEPILDKIRAELLMMECMEDAVEVIDKYRQEGMI